MRESLNADDLSEYLRAKEPGRAELAGMWRAAIGLQKVDGLKPSAYLMETARRNIEGEITLEEAGKAIGEYYKSKAVRAEAAKTRTDEADIVSQRITEILAEPTFSFSPASYTSIHRKLFAGIYKHAGKIRDYNITKFFRTIPIISGTRLYGQTILTFPKGFILRLSTLNASSPICCLESTTSGRAGIFLSGSMTSQGRLFLRQGNK